jgi:copper oxidase (laccase) domain-containing protein
VERYEVGEELVDEFRAAFPDAPASPDGTHLDLPAIASWQLEQAGLNPKRIFNSGECTRSQLDRYHSFRGEAEHAGRILSFIGFQADYF